MNNLQIVTLLLAAALLPAYLAMVLAPTKMRGGFRKFPRNRPAGWLLTAVAIAWAAWYLYNMPLGNLDVYKNLLYVLAPLTYVLVLLCMDELLAARALGAVLALAPTPILVAARVNHSPYKVVMVAVAYIMAIKGIIIFFSPYLFRDLGDKFVKSDRACRNYGIVGLIFVAIIASLALLAY